MNRAFRITFNPNVSQFVIEIQGFLGLSWKPAKDADKQVKTFATFGDAQAYVKTIGLDRVYSDFTLNVPYGSQPDVPTLADIKVPCDVPPDYVKGHVRWLDPIPPYPTLNKESA